VVWEGSKSLNSKVEGWPLLSSYSRIYLAAHYPGDVLVGWVVGSFAAVGLVGVMIKIGIKARD
jgi:membrane-associated phospholipid phosphatase